MDENTGIQTKLARKKLLSTAAFYLANEIDDDLGLDVDLGEAEEMLNEAVLEYAAQIEGGDGE